MINNIIGNICEVAQVREACVKLLVDGEMKTACNIGASSS
jgi:hypothetical protein